MVHQYSNKTDIVKHVGSYRTQQERESLEKRAYQYIANDSFAPPLLPDFYASPQSPDEDSVTVKNIRFVKTYHLFAYEFLSGFYSYCGFDSLRNELLKDLALLRIVEPASKRASVALLREYFDKNYSEGKIYKHLSKILLLAPCIEQSAVTYAKTHLSFNFSIVFYDVTTLYYESFVEDDAFRKCGFSKDHKANQPQIMIGLVVTQEGYPIAIHSFEGNVFEGHTIIPVILAMKKKYDIKRLTVVADAAMLSFENMKLLTQANLDYIVGARLSNISAQKLKEISQSVDTKEGIYHRQATVYGDLICDYSKKRAAKDKHERKKQVAKAQKQLEAPGKQYAHTRFLKTISPSVYVINTELIAKDEMLDGLKGYYTSLKEVEPSIIVSRYKDLWHVEKSFRIAKSDLLARPIFHFKKEHIQAHMYIVFIALCIAKSIEMTTGLSIHKVIKLIWKIQDIEFEDALTKKMYRKRMEFSNEKLLNFCNKIAKKISTG